MTIGEAFPQHCSPTAELFSQRSHHVYAEAGFITVFGSLTSQRRVCDEAIDIGSAFEYFRCDALRRQRFGNLEHFRNPAMRFGWHERKLAQQRLIKVSTRLPQLLLQHCV